MKPLYDAAYGDDPDMEAEFGWKEKDKKEEMWSDHAWYLLARCQLYSLKMLFRIPTPPLLELRRARLLHSPIFAMTWTMMTRSPLFSSNHENFLCIRLFTVMRSKWRRGTGEKDLADL